MRCPRCGHEEDKVIDSRSARNGDVIRRRRITSPFRAERLSITLSSWCPQRGQRMVSPMDDLGRQRSRKRRRRQARTAGERPREAQNQGPRGGDSGIMSFCPTRMEFASGRRLSWRIALTVVR